MNKKRTVREIYDSEILETAIKIDKLFDEMNKGGIKGKWKCW